MPNKLTPNQQKVYDEILRLYRSGDKTGAVWSPPCEGDTSRRAQALRKMLKLKLVLYVGCGPRSGIGYKYGAGLIPADEYEPAFHTLKPFPEK